MTILDGHFDLFFDRLAIKQRSLLFFSHGHDMRGRDTCAGVWHDDGHRQLGLSRGDPIALQALERGFLTLVPATRGLAKEATSLPSLKGRHVKRPCRAQ